MLTRARGVGREDDLHQAPREQHLDELLEHRQQAGVVEADALARQARDDLDLVELAVLLAQCRDVGVEDVRDLRGLLGGDSQR